MTFLAQYAKWGPHRGAGSPWAGCNMGDRAHERPSESAPPRDGARQRTASRRTPSALSRSRLAHIAQSRLAEGTTHMHIIWILLIGLIVGALAKLVMPGKDPGGAIVTILIGIAGSFIANFIGRAAGWYAPNESAGFIAS